MIIGKMLLSIGIGLVIFSIILRKVIDDTNKAAKLYRLYKEGR